MYINIEDINIEKLRQDLIDYFTSAMFLASPVALIDLTRVENAGEKELIQIAINGGFNLNNYINKYTR